VFYSWHQHWSTCLRRNCYHEVAPLKNYCRWKTQPPGRHCGAGAAGRDISRRARRRGLRIPRAQIRRTSGDGGGGQAVHLIIVAPLPGHRGGGAGGHITRRSRGHNLRIPRRIKENLNKATQTLEKTAATQVVVGARHGSGTNAERVARATRKHLQEEDVRPARRNGSIGGRSYRRRFGSAGATTATATGDFQDYSTTMTINHC
jgi:DNA-binding transcriptional regulator YdaS (Cro superfamily)